MARTKSPSDMVRAASAVMASGDPLGGALGLRERLLELAGYTVEEQARLTRAALLTAQEALTARKVTRLVVNNGRNVSQVEEFDDIDHATRLRAADLLLDRFGIQVSKTTQNTNNIGSLTVIVQKREPPPPAQVVVDVQAREIVD